MAKEKKRRKIDILDIVRALLLIIMLVAIGIIAVRLWDYKKGTDSYNELREETTQQAQPEEDLGFVPLRVDFVHLKEKMPDIIAWIGFDSVDVSYPVVYSGDNSYYLRRMWDGSYNQAGTIFLEGKNKTIDDLHAILYGHNMRNGSMFAPLKAYMDESFFEENGGWFTVYTPEQTWRYQLFSVHVVDPNDPLYAVGFSEGEEYTEFVQGLRNGSMYDTGVTVNPDDHVLTLSTCTDDGHNRIVFHARRVEEIEIK